MNRLLRIVIELGLVAAWALVVFAVEDAASAAGTGSAQAGAPDPRAAALAADSRRSPAIGAKIAPTI